MTPIPESIATEARAKLMWGESPVKVRAFLDTKKVERADAEILIENVLAEQAAESRSEGKNKIVIGALLVLAPVVYYFVAAAMGFLMIKLFAVLLVLAVIGIAKLSKGIAMVARPRAVKETLADRF